MGTHYRFDHTSALSPIKCTFSLFILSKNFHCWNESEEKLDRNLSVTRSVNMYIINNGRIFDQTEGGAVSKLTVHRACILCHLSGKVNIGVAEL